MYRIPHYDVQQLEQLHALVRERPFAVLALTIGADIVANHVPVLLRSGSTPSGLLVGHVARANPVWSDASQGTPALVIFQGVEHYISPRWYLSPGSDTKALPTWDYAVVHVRGHIEWIHDLSWLRGLLEEMAVVFERGAEVPWKMDNVPADYAQRMLGGIVGFQVPVEVVQGKFKLNQRSTDEDRSGIVAELNRLGTDSARAMATAIARAVEK